MKAQIIIALAIAWLSITVVQSQSINENHIINDHLFPQKGRSMVTFGTGVPYVAVAEYGYGISERLSVGLLAGITPSITGLGIRVRGVLCQRGNNFRLYIKVPVLYYPKTKGLGGEPWILARPALNAERKLDSGLRLSFGVGLVAAACVNDLFGLDHSHEKTSHNDHDRVHEDLMIVDHFEDKGFMGDIWNTLQAGIALPINEKFMFQTEFGLVFKGFQVAGDEWVGGPPIILISGLSIAF
jgi:hypothetical protein